MFHTRIELNGVMYTRKLLPQIECWHKLHPTSRKTRIPTSRSCPIPDAGSRRRIQTLQCRAAVASPPQNQEIASYKFEAGINATVTDLGGIYQVNIQNSHPRDMILHWAVNSWNEPDKLIWPEDTNPVDGKAVQTRFKNGSNVQINIPADKCPNRIVFVLKELSPENWISNGSTDFAVQIKPPDFSEVSEKALKAEGSYSHWSLFDRFCLVNELLDAADSAGPEGMAFIAVWLRLSHLRQLDWYRNSAHQSKDIAHVQKTVAQRVADKARGASSPENRFLARVAMTNLPRGGGDGDAIRMGILNIMRDNGIREGHRPGIEDHFLEQWHQKLHTNTTPEDINICEAYLGCLHTGNPDDFWRFLWENGQITREQLANMDRPVTATPLHLPHLINPFKHYLWILKVVHSGADMDTALEMAKGNLDGDLAWNISDILQNRTAWWVPGKIVEVRERLAGYWKAEGASRDILLLDISLDSYFRLCIERAEKSQMSGDDLFGLVSLVLRNAVIGNESRDLQQCLALWEKVGGEERWSKEWGLKATAAAQRVSISLAAFADRLYELMQPHAQAFKDACKIDPQYITNFGEEVVRGQPLFVLSIILQHLDPVLRKTAELGSWQVVSQSDAQGTVKVVSSLADVQGQNFDSQTVLIAEKVGGNEDIPENITAVLTSSTTDVLSHAAIRARSQNVLFATCFEPSELDALKQMEGEYVTLSVDPNGSVTANVGSDQKAKSNGASPVRRTPKRVSVSQVKSTGEWALQESEFAPGLVGGKSLNLAGMRKQLQGKASLPTSVAIPFGSFERVLSSPKNKDVRREVENLINSLERSRSKSGVPKELAELRSLVRRNLQCPPEVHDQVSWTAETAGLIEKGEWNETSAAWKKTWSAICGVWASKWNDRAWLSRNARGIRDNDLKMAALLQKVHILVAFKEQLNLCSKSTSNCKQVFMQNSKWREEEYVKDAPNADFIAKIIPAEYAFVVHTANPITGKQGEIVGELVVGMGETLVGNKPGRALSFTASSNGAQPDVSLQFLPSKRVGLFSPSDTSNVIVRSDSNGEDLEAFAGAGLYDSIPLEDLEEHTLETAAEGIFWDTDYTSKILKEIAKTGFEVEKAFNGVPQDIEGVWRDGEITIVQSRPQVL